MHKSRSLFNLTTALHVSAVSITHLQEHKTTVTTASGNRYTLLLCAAIVEELELMCTFTISTANTPHSSPPKFKILYIYNAIKMPSIIIITHNMQYN
jgi:hypothetical protein